MGISSRKRKQRSNALQRSAEEYANSLKPGPPWKPGNLQNYNRDRVNEQRKSVELEKREKDFTFAMALVGVAVGFGFGLVVAGIIHSLTP